MAFTNEPKPELGIPAKLSFDEDGNILVMVCDRDAEKSIAKNWCGLPSISFRAFDKKDCLFCFTDCGQDNCRLKELPSGIFGECDLKQYKLIAVE